MKKGYGIALLILGIILVVYNVIVFVLPIPKTPDFWVAYVFSTVAILLQVGIDYVAFKNDNRLKSIFLGLPIANIGSIYLALQLVWGAILMAVPIIPTGIAVVISVVLLGWCLVSVIMTSTARDVVTAVDTRIREKTSFIRLNQVAVEMLIGQTDNAALKQQLTDLRDKIRYSDPMSDASLGKLESQIEVRISDLKDAVDSGDIAGATAQVTRLGDLILERNKLCKALK